MKYILPLTINNRRTNYLDLKGRFSESNESFIIELPLENNAFTLFSIDKSKLMQTLVTNESDVLLANLQLNVSFDATIPQLHIHLSTSSKPAAFQANTDEEDDWKNPTKPQPTVVQPTFQQNSYLFGDIEFSVIDAANDFKIIGHYIDHIPEEPIQQDYINCHFSYESNGKTYQNRLHFHLAHASCFHHFGLDFGSEASQLKVSNYQYINRRYTKKSPSKSLFKLVKDFKGLTEDDQNFIQFEKNTDFIKSIFFLKKKLHDFHERKDRFIKNEGELKFLVQKNELNSNLTNNFHQLSNLKLAHKHGDILKFMDFQSILNDKVRSLSLDDLKNQAYSTILKSFIEATLHNVLDDESENTFIRFTVLVPNIYSIHEVANTKEVINEVFKDLQQHAYAHKIKAWEVVTISESDAAFLGYFSKGLNEISANKYYIIVDCGKGTTDFSIIQTGSNNSRKIKSLYRNGFAGAGNLISYAFFESILHFILKNSLNPAATKAFFLESLEKAEKGQMNQLFEKIESLKFQYSKRTPENQEAVERAWNAAAQSGDVNLRTFANNEFTATIANLNLLLQKVDGFYDWGGYVENACEVITSNIVENMKGVVTNIEKGIDCEGILLTGRGFLFAPLLEKLKEKMTKDLGFSSNLIKMPTEASQLKAICLDGIFASGYIVHPELVGFPIQISTRKQEKAPTPTKAKMPAFFDFLLRLSNMHDNYDESKNSYRINDLDSLKFLIGNTLYTVADTNFHDKKWLETPPDLIFTKEGFYVRNISKSNQIKGYSGLEQNSEIDTVTLQYLIPSLFPAKIDIEYIQSLKGNQPPPDDNLLNLISLLPD